MEIKNRTTVSVENTDELNGLIARILDTGEFCYIPAEEVSRREIRDSRCMLGKMLHAVPVGRTFRNLPVYSSKEVEEAEYEKICADFRERRRNTYPAEFIGIDKSGTLALYAIAPGIAGAVHLREFCFNRLNSYLDFDLPRMLPVTILEIKDDKLILSSLASFGTFRENVEALGLQRDSVVEGFVAGLLPKGDGVVVMLAPNLTTVLNWAPLDKKVRVRITGIDFDRNRVKSVYVGECCDDTPLDFSWFVKCPEEAFVDIRTFAAENKVKKGSATEKTSEGAGENKVETVLPPSFEITAADSPLRIRENETITLDTSLHYKHLDKGVSSGKLTRKHMDLAEAVDALRFTSVYHLQRYLYLTKQGIYSTTVLDNCLKQLCEYKVLMRFRYSSGAENEKHSIYYVYCRGINYKRFGCSFKSFSSQMPVEGMTSSFAKGRMAVNQLLIGILHNYADADMKSSYLFESCEEDIGKLYACYKLHTAELGSCVLESCRADYNDKLIEKMLRYDRRFRLVQQEKSAVIVTLEDKDHMDRFTDRIRDMHLCYPVYLTYDVKCFEKGFQTILLPDTPTDDFRKQKNSLWDKLKDLGGFLTGLVG